MSEAQDILISVVIATHNAAPGLLSAALESAARQSVAPLEVIVVDNASIPPVAVHDDQSHRVRVVREAKLGVIHARCTGIRCASGNWIVFVDDDNQIASDYLEQAAQIVRAHPEIGAFSGMSMPKFDGPVAKWKRRLLPYLGVHDHGPQPITSNSGDWGEGDPIGAGMVFRKDVGMRFVEMVENDSATLQLGRAGTGLMSGEDTLIARVAWMMHYACSYQPALHLTHAMRPGRMKLPVLVRTLLGHGRSYIVLQRILGRPPGRIAWYTPLSLFSSYIFRVRTEGVRAGSVVWFWDLGRVLQLLEEPRRSGD